MAGSIYSEKLVKPNDKMLACDLVDSKTYLDRLGSFIENEYGNFKPEWKFYNKKTGWILKMFTKKRNVLFVVPCDKYFRVAFVYGDKASNLIFNSDLPDLIKKDLSEAKRYMEGRIIELDVRTENDFENILKMVKIKLSN